MESFLKDLRACVTEVGVAAAAAKVAQMNGGILLSYHQHNHLPPTRHSLNLSIRKSDQSVVKLYFAFICFIVVVYLCFCTSVFYFVISYCYFHVLHKPDLNPILPEPIITKP